MSRKRKAIIAAIVIGVILLIICCCVVAYFLLNTPLGQSLQIDTPSPEIQSTQTAEDITHCGEKGSVNILIMGVDSPFGDGFEGPLTIRLVKLDFIHQTANVYSFPRDLWVSVQGLESYGITQERLGRLYLFAKDDVGVEEAVAINLVAQTLYQNFGAFSDHYIVGKMATLAEIIDIAGGITVQVPADHDATPWGMHFFPAGPNHMTGLLAMEYAVTPTLAGQWNGWERQSLVLYTLFQQLLSPDMLPKLPQLIPQFLQVVTTDLTVQQMLNILCISQEIPRELTQFAEVEPEEVTFGPNGVQYPDVEAIRAKVQEILGSGNP